MIFGVATNEDRRQQSDKPKQTGKNHPVNDFWRSD
jgi:hypothetical protein